MNSDTVIKDNTSRMPPIEGNRFRRNSPMDSGLMELASTNRVTVVDNGYKKDIEAGSTFFVLPEIVGRIDDAVAQVSVVTTIADAARILGAESSIVSFTSDRVLKCVLTYPDLFAANLAVLEGYPEAMYSESFRDITFQLPKQSYEQLALDIASARRAADALAKERIKTPEGKDEAATNSLGRVKSFDKFDETVSRRPRATPPELSDSYPDA